MILCFLAFKKGVKEEWDGDGSEMKHEQSVMSKSWINALHQNALHGKSWRRNPHPAPETLGSSLNLAHPASLVSQAMPPSQGFPTRKHQPAPAAEKKKSLNFMNLCLQLESLPLILMFIDFLMFAGDLALVLSTAETWICEAKLVELVLK